MQIFKNPNFNFVRWRWHALFLSWAVILAGAITIWTVGLQMGVEFSGGTIVIVQFDKTPTVDQVRTAMDRAKVGGGGQNVVVQRYGPEEGRKLMVRLAESGVEQGAGLSRTAEHVVNALNQANVGKFNVVGTQIVGPVVGKELTRKGLWATGLSLAGILLYIAFRFRLSFAVGAVVATLHDILITLAFLAFFRYDMSLNVIAAILTVTGYSTNDTIVIFDRVRENLRSMRRDSIDHVVNVAVNQTLGRTVITAGTTLLSVVALYVFGGEVLRGFAFTMMVGVITGTYSSVFIAAAIVTFWKSKASARVPVTAPVAAGNGGRKKAGGGKAKAS
jgi:preprotein translocase subunit SecF